VGDDVMQYPGCLRPSSPKGGGGGGGGCHVSRWR
jgi:hypothetical protein